MKKKNSPLSEKYIDPSLKNEIRSPLQKILGLPVAEETYDLLPLREQIILDMLIVGWNQAQIGLVFGVKASGISAHVRGIRAKLADSKLKMILELRQMVKEGEL